MHRQQLLERMSKVQEVSTMLAWGSNEEAVAYMREVAGGQRASPRWLGVIPKVCFEGEAKFELQLR